VVLLPHRRPVDARIYMHVDVRACVRGRVGAGRGRAWRAADGEERGWWRGRRGTARPGACSGPRPGARARCPATGAIVMTVTSAPGPSTGRDGAPIATRLAGPSAASAGPWAAWAGQSAGRLARWAGQLTGRCAAGRAVPRRGAGAAPATGRRRAC